METPLERWAVREVKALGVALAAIEERLKEMRVQLSDADIIRLADLLSDPVRYHPILTTDEAVKYCRFSSRRKFYAWVRRVCISPSEEGRWPRRRLDEGMDREASGFKPPRSLQHKLAGRTADGRPT